MLADKFIKFEISTAKLHDRSLSRFDTVPACDGQTDGWTDERIFYAASTALCTASYDNALQYKKAVLSQR